MQIGPYTRIGPTVSASGVYEGQHESPFVLPGVTSSLKWEGVPWPIQGRHLYKNYPMYHGPGALLAPDPLLGPARPRGRGVGLGDGSFGSGLFTGTTVAVVAGAWILFSLLRK